MKKPFHKSQLCPGEMQWDEVPGKFGLIRGWRCVLCGKMLPYWKNPLHHVKGVGQ